MIRTRIAPSPTGYMHVGTLRTGLYSYLFAKKHGGQFLLRIEDTDRERLVEDATLVLLQSSYWAGVIPDEGVMLNKEAYKRGEGVITQSGDKGPYIQSERLPIYHEHIKTLLANGSAYYCFCTGERLEELRQKQQLNKLPTIYDRHCLKIDPNEIQARVEKGEPHVIRLKMPQTGETVFEDLIRGEIRFENKLIDDQVLIKSDGFPTYHFAVVIDDHLMEISHVIRGEEWISSTPKHLQLYKYFGWEPPQFGHLSLILNPDKSKLSKRQGDVAVGDYQKKGYLPEALLNFIAFLGWNPGDDRELFTLEELIKEFSLEKVSKAGAVFNVEKLNWYNKEYIKKLSNEELVERAEPWLKEVFKEQEKEQLIKAVGLEKERITTLAELPEAIKFVFKLPDYPKEFLVWKKSTPEEAKKILEELKNYLSTLSIQFTKPELEIKIGEWIKSQNYSNGSVLWPLRVALSGQQNSPGPYEIAEVLGKEEVVKRIEVALQKM
jgi:glutamyl-tRNA synthetase